jgi:tRNA nucleotidyltransferase/poly(A) polymerase
MRGRAGIRGLSAERIGQEMRRLAVAPLAVTTLRAMQDAGILPVVLGGVAYVATLARVVALEAAVGVPAALPLRLVALAARVDEDVARLTARLRLANAERVRMARALAAARAVTPRSDLRTARRVLYRLGGEAFRDGLVLSAAIAATSSDDPTVHDLYRLPDRWSPPVFPLGGRDLLAAGLRSGPAFRRLLDALEEWWIERDFAPEPAALRARLDQMLAAEQ